MRDQAFRGPHRGNLCPCRSPPVRRQAYHESRCIRLQGKCEALWCSAVSLTAGRHEAEPERFQGISGPSRQAATQRAVGPASQTVLLSREPVRTLRRGCSSAGEPARTLPVGLQLNWKRWTHSGWAAIMALACESAALGSPRPRGPSLLATARAQSGRGRARGAHVGGVAPARRCDASRSIVKASWHALPEAAVGPLIASRGHCSSAHFGVVSATRRRRVARQSS
jgi:hypothetical protein